ncbi:MAG: YmdB family metallophosphoesterase, partial [Opitutaceae bacterium]|nr:YmdB family metallophosphoesterase [Opitutaceae bacterium]
DFVVANGENTAAGAGITGKIAKRLLESGVDGITLGDHVWDQKTFVTDIDSLEAFVVRRIFMKIARERIILFWKKGAFD